MLSIFRYCIQKQTKSSIAALSGITAATFSTMAVQGVDFHKLSNETKLKTLPGHSEIPARSLWEESGAVIQIVRRPG